MATSSAPVEEVGRIARHNGDIKITIKLPTLESHASQLGIRTNTYQWEKLSRQRQVAEKHLKASREAIRDPREFEGPGTWRDLIRQSLGLMSISMCIAALAMSTEEPDEQSSTEYFYLCFSQDCPSNWTDFQQRVDEAGGRAEVIVYVGYPQAWLDRDDWRHEIEQYVVLSRPEMALKSFAEVARVPEGMIKRLAGSCVQMTDSGPR